jgi:hypothetical protein
VTARPSALRESGAVMIWDLPGFSDFGNVNVRGFFSSGTVVVVESLGDVVVGATVVVVFVDVTVVVGAITLVQAVAPISLVVPAGQSEADFAPIVAT